MSGEGDFVDRDFDEAFAAMFEDDVFGLKNLTLGGPTPGEQQTQHQQQPPPSATTLPSRLSICKACNIRYAHEQSAAGFNPADKIVCRKCFGWCEPIEVSSGV
jgi:hypothetical protein